MITGQVPFDGESQAEILMKHLSEHPDLNRLPPRLRPVLAKALEKDPSRRYQSALELEREFERAVKDIDRGVEFAETAYPADDSVRPAYAPPPPVRERYAHHQPQPYDRYRYSRYAGAGEQPGGLGIFKWILIGFALVFLFPKMLHSHAISRLMVIGGMAALAVYAIKRVARYTVGTPAYEYTRPINHKSPSSPPTREELRRAAMERREQRVAAMEARRETVRQARAERRAENLARHNRAYANVSTTLKRPIPLRQRAMEFSTSATLATFTTVLVTFGLLLTSDFLNSTTATLFSTLTLLGSWTILGTAKVLEGGDHGWSNKRALFLGAGALVGVAAWFVSTNLFVNFDPDQAMARSVGNIVLTDYHLQPTMAGFAAFFAGLFGLRRWGWHADAFRDRRFRLRSVLLTTAIGWLWAYVIGFPILWAVTWAAALSSVVQLSASWVPFEDRQRVLMEAQNHVV
jgi:hypothetical protein